MGHLFNYGCVFDRIRQRSGLRIEDTLFSANPLLASAIRANVRIVGRQAFVPLLPRWPVLVQGLRTFGRVISICENSYAVLGSTGSYPRVLSTPCGQEAVARDLKFFFPCWSRAFAVIEEESGTWHYSAEFRDACGDVIHRVCLTGDSDLEAFRSWVELNHAADSVAELSPHVRTPARIGDVDPLRGGDVSLLSEKDFRAFLRRLIEAETSVRIVVNNDGLTQGAEMCPNCLREEAGPIYVGDDECGLQLSTGRLAEIAFRWAPDSSDWILMLYEPEGRLVCTIAPASGSCPQEQ